MSPESTTETMEPDEFLERLHAGEFERDLVFSGMVKEDEQEEGVIQFSQGRNCENWVSIPTDKIKSVTMSQVVSCADHSHPYVELELKTPSTDEGEFFADVLGQLAAGNEEPRGPMPGPNATMFGGDIPDFASPDNRPPPMGTSERRIAPGASVGRVGGGRFVEMDCHDMCSMFRRVCYQFDGSVYDCEREFWGCMFDLC